MDPDDAGSGPFYRDAACNNQVSYRSTSFRCFCRDNLKSNEHTRGYIGNPAAWRAQGLDPVAPGETTWTLSQGSRLHITAVGSQRTVKPCLQLDIARMHSSPNAARSPRA
jgi:hypothetical protein